MHARVSAPVQDGRLAARRPERPAVAGRGGGREEAAPALPWEEAAALGALAGEAALLDQAAPAARVKEGSESANEILHMRLQCILILTLN